MSKVDWSLAPEGATHYSAGNSSCSTYPAWWRPSLEASNKYECWAIGTSFGCETWQKGPFNLPSIAVKREWSGPEDGLPPVGTVCEYQTIGATNDWQEVEILCHFTAQKEVAVFVPVKGYRNVKQAIAECFRPIKTPDQISADKRETAIREIMDVADVDCRVTAARLVDAGFKREVV